MLPRRAMEYRQRRASRPGRYRRPPRAASWSGFSSRIPTRSATTPASWPGSPAPLEWRRRATPTPCSHSSRTASCTRAWPTTASSRRSATSRRFLAAGCNVVSSSPVMLQYPEPGDPLAAPVIAAAEKAGVSIFVNGVDPGFANDALPLVLSGICERIEEVRCSEVLNYNTYNQPMVLFDIMGFGRRPGRRADAAEPGRAHHGVGQRGPPDRRRTRRDAHGGDRVVRARGGARGLRDRRRDHQGRHGRRAALRGARHGGRPAVVVLEHVTRLRDDLGAAWPKPAGQGCYRVQITGEPNYTLDLQLMGTDGDHNTAGLKATAMRLSTRAGRRAVAAGPGHRARSPTGDRAGSGRHLTRASSRDPSIGPAARSCRRRAGPERTNLHKPTARRG